MALNITTPAKSSNKIAFRLQCDIERMGDAGRETGRLNIVFNTESGFDPQAGIQGVQLRTLIADGVYSGTASPAGIERLAADPCVISIMGGRPPQPPI